MKYIITGISGFVGKYLINYLLENGHEVVGVDLLPFSLSDELKQKILFVQMSLLDLLQLKDFVKNVSPDRIIHLASASSVALSWEKPVECFTNNTNIFLNLVEAVRAAQIKCRILSVGSSEEYGPVSTTEGLLDESKPLNPISPYAAARVAQEHLSKIYSFGYGLDIVCTRSFNHIGPGQREQFVVSSFVKQAVEVSLNKRQIITCGNLDIIRDFIDVRDVIRVYEYILDYGVSGDVYNVCSGKGISLRNILGRICEKLQIKKEWNVLSNLIRPLDNPIIIGNNQKVRKLGFEISYNLDESLDDMIHWWKKKVIL